MNKKNCLCRKLIISFIALSFGLIPQILFSAEVNFDIFCFESAHYAVIGEVVDIEDICEDYRHMKDRYGNQPVNIEIKEVLKGGPLPRYISVLFDFGDTHSEIKEEIENGRKILLFLNPSLAYYYIPVLYGSVYLLEENNIEIYKKQLNDTYAFFHAVSSESLLKEYGFFDYHNCKIFYTASGGHSPYYMRKLAISDGGITECEIGRVGDKNVEKVKFRLSREFIQELISDLARMDFYNIKYIKDKNFIDAVWHKITYSYTGKKHNLEGYAETYTNDLTEYQFSNLLFKLNKVLDYAEENKSISFEQISEFRDISSTSYSFEYVREKCKNPNYRCFEEASRCDEKDKLIPYLISKLDFKDNTFWFQGETRVNLVRILRYITKCELGYNDKFIYNSDDEKIQKVKYSWENWWQNKN